MASSPGLTVHDLVLRRLAGMADEIARPSLDLAESGTSPSEGVLSLCSRRPRHVLRAPYADQIGAEELVASIGQLRTSWSRTYGGF